MKKNHHAIIELTSEYLDAFVAFRKESIKETEWLNSLSEDKAKGLIKEYSESKNKRAFIAIGENDDEVVGQLFMTSSVAPGDVSFISLISVRNKCKGTGLGRRLLSKAVSVAKEEKTKKCGSSSVLKTRPPLGSMKNSVLFDLSTAGSIT